MTELLQTIKKWFNSSHSYSSWGDWDSINTEKLLSFNIANVIYSTEPPEPIKTRNKRR